MGLCVEYMYTYILHIITYTDIYLYQLHVYNMILDHCAIKTFPTTHTQIRNKHRHLPWPSTHKFDAFPAKLSRTCAMRGRGTFEMADCLHTPSRKDISLNMNLTCQLSTLNGIDCIQTFHTFTFTFCICICLDIQTQTTTKIKTCFATVDT